MLALSLRNCPRGSSKNPLPIFLLPGSRENPYHMKYGEKSIALFWNMEKRLLHCSFKESQGGRLSIHKNLFSPLSIVTIAVTWLTSQPHLQIGEHVTKLSSVENDWKLYVLFLLSAFKNGIMLLYMPPPTPYFMGLAWWWSERI